MAGLTAFLEEVEMGAFYKTDNYGIVKVLEYNSIYDTYLVFSTVNNRFFVPGFILREKVENPSHKPMGI